MTETIEVKRIDKPSGNGHKPKFDWKSEVQTHNQLMCKELPPIKFLIHQLLVRPGLGVIGGKKKTGKSYLVGDLAIAISQGKQFLGLDTVKTKVVYFALEDGERRTKQRLLQKKAPLDLDITYFYKWPALNTDLGRNQFIEMIKELKPGLVIIDTLVSSKNKLVDENDNNAMADFINWMHAICIAYDLSILIVAHHGKISTGEPGFDIRGASATPGATDVNIGLYKKDGFSDLVIEGRDIPSLELSIIWNNFVWQLKGNASEIRRTEAEDKILEALMILGNKAEALQIAKVANISRSTAQYHLEIMRTTHKVEYEIEVIKNTPHIRYYLKDMPNTQTPQQPQHPNTPYVVEGVDESLEGPQHPQNESNKRVASWGVGAVDDFPGLASDNENDDDGYYDSLTEDGLSKEDLGEEE